MLLRVRYPAAQPAARRRARQQNLARRQRASGDHAAQRGALVAHIDEFRQQFALAVMHLRRAEVHALTKHDLGLLRARHLVDALAVDAYRCHSNALVGQRQALEHIFQALGFASIFLQPHNRQAAVVHYVIDNFCHPRCLAASRARKHCRSLAMPAAYLLVVVFRIALMAFQRLGLNVHALAFEQ